MAVEVPSGELAAWLAANREPLIRRWLAMLVERGSLDDLARRPFSERMQELDLMLEAARAEATETKGTVPFLSPPEGGERKGTVPVVARFSFPSGDGPPARAWRRALELVTRAGERVVPADGGAIAVELGAASVAEAETAAFGIRSRAHELLGRRGPLPDVSVDGHEPRSAEPAPPAEDLWAAFARERARRRDEADAERPPAPVTPLRRR